MTSNVDQLEDRSERPPESRRAVRHRNYQQITSARSMASHSSNTAEGIAPGTPTRRATLGATREIAM